MLLQSAGIQNKATKQAREYKEPGFQFTRRIIALASVGAIIVLPLVAGWLTPWVPISYGFVESINGFMFFTDPSKYIAWTTGTGIVIGPLHTHLVYAIAGMYFGNGSVK